MKPSGVNSPDPIFHSLAEEAAAAGGDVVCCPCPPPRAPGEEGGGREEGEWWRHAWVLVRRSPAKEVTEDLFVNPASGRMVPVRDPGLPYAGVQALFNAENYWLRLTPHMVPVPASSTGGGNVEDVGEACWTRRKM